MVSMGLGLWGQVPESFQGRAPPSREDDAEGKQHGPGSRVKGQGHRVNEKELGVIRGTRKGKGAGADCAPGALPGWPWRTVEEGQGSRVQGPGWHQDLARPPPGAAHAPLSPGFAWAVTGGTNAGVGAALARRISKGRDDGTRQGDGCNEGTGVHGESRRRAGVSEEAACTTAEMGRRIARWGGSPPGV